MHTLVCCKGANMTDKKNDLNEDISNIKKENVSRDKIALQALIRVTALEKILVDKGLISNEELMKNITIIASEIVNSVKKSIKE